ncbi:glyoxylate/hydroxypyruvate reductase A [Leptobacterium flavescens]|uniref:Glyoxylate/hydroxypyruvate reductase A n=1 Tax=Leptobacterium flavescens TaxID=472055 RepID=A0A6P0UNQ8_9FLAO|nr:glyoxylate/hydroxypyruvate reductase A [Leptobacterium flavescens]NER14944.1 glyoxylate/hydroxypyruvate reductase A [Leptobacterium flavescens]
MSILIVFNNKDPKPWEKILKQKLMQADVSIFPQVKDPATVRFVLCWKPEKDILDRFPNLRVVQSVGAAVEHITRTQNLNENIIISRIVDSRLSEDMWEFLLAAVMQHLKGLSHYSRQQQEKLWQQKEYRTVDQTTVSVLGLGKMGGLVAAKFARLGFKVKGWSASEKSIPKVEAYTGAEELDGFLANSDILINLLPLTHQTEGILNRENLQKLKKGAYLINVGRGEHLVENDLTYLLDREHLSGALLDVFTMEPLPECHSFWEHPKIQITPHIASLTNINSAADQVIENYRNFLEGKPLLNTVSLQKGY